MSRDRFGILSTRQLRDVLEDEEKLSRMVQLSPQLQTLQLEREMILASNRKMAEDNLSLHPRLDDKKLHLARKYQELQEVTVVYEDKQRKLAAYLERQSPRTALELLQREAVKSEEESEHARPELRQARFEEQNSPLASDGILQASPPSEEITDTFLAGKVSLESFLERFHMTRKLCHMRKTQVEKLQDLLKKDRKKNQQQAMQQRPEHRVTSHNVPPSPHNGPTGHGLHQRYSFAPTIEVSSQATSPFSMPSPPPQSKNLPPLSSRERQHVVSRPNTPFTPHGLRSGLRMLGQLPIWTPRPFKLQRAYPVQKQPPYR